MDNDNKLWFLFLLPYGIFRNIVQKGELDDDAKTLKYLKKRAKRESGWRRHFY